MQHIPGLHLEANYRGGVSVRDRLACGHAVANRILETRQWQSVERKRREETERFGGPVMQSIEAMDAAIE